MTRKAPSPALLPLPEPTPNPASEASTARALHRSGFKAKAGPSPSVSTQPVRATPDRQSLGRLGEQLAAEYLQHRGYEVLERNVRFRHGEIDLVVLDGSTVVFVEVKTRRSKRFGRPEHAVVGRKAARLWALGEAWLVERSARSAYCRFDIVAVTVAPDGRAHIEHLRNAFTGNF